MNIIKRNGEEMSFDINKIVVAISKANKEVPLKEQFSPAQVQAVADKVAQVCYESHTAMNVEAIQDLVEEEIMRAGGFSIAKKYITYRYQHELMRKANSTDRQILSLLECSNEEVKQENSNKNSTVVSVQRDYMAGEVSKDITKRFLLDEDIVKAHQEGIIHFHDSDYFAQHMHNCDLVNLEDMLQNGTVISGTYIDTPRSFSTACNIATQIIAQVASCQYGGQSISLTHLAPFVDVCRKRIAKDLEESAQTMGIAYTQEQFDYMVQRRLREEVQRGVQTIQYQVVTLMTTNGQSPFVSVFMYLNEARSQQEKDDLAMIIQEVLEQRYQGVKNESGHWDMGTAVNDKVYFPLSNDWRKKENRIKDCTLRIEHLLNKLQ